MKLELNELLDITVEPFNEDIAKYDLAGIENQFVDKLTDGIGMDIGEIVVDPYEEEEDF